MSWAKHSASSDTCNHLAYKYLILSFYQRQEAKLWINQGTFALLGKQMIDDSS